MYFMKIPTLLQYGYYSAYHKILKEGSNNKLEITNFDPFASLKISMIALCVQGIRVVFVFVCHMSQEGMPLCGNERSKTWSGRGSAPV